MSDPEPVLVISTGDPQGIGPAITARALDDADRGTARVIVVAPRALGWSARHPGHEEVLAGRATIGLYEVETPDAFLGEVGPSAAGGAAAMAVLEAAEVLVRAAPRRALVTAPVSKEAITQARAEAFVGHTDWLAERASVDRVVMCFVAEELRVALATVHLPLAEVSRSLSIDGLVRTLEVLNGDLRHRFGIAEPRIAVLGLNPHAGEGGLLGHEEAEIIVPAIEAARGRGIGATGPFSADTFFTPGRLAGCDAVLAMFHDQGLIPVKCLAFGRSVNVSLGLPYPRTSVDHGTAFDLVARRGTADPSSMRHAITQAARLLGA